VVAEVQDSWRNSPARRADTYPQSDHITWIFPGNESSGGHDLPVEWFDGDKYPPAEAQEISKALGFDSYPAEASLVIGSEGALLLPHQSGPQLYPKEKFKSLPRPQLKGPSHYHRFVNACLGGEATNSPFEKTGPMAEAIVLGTLAIRVPGTVLEWNASACRISNSPEAERLLRRTYRKGWEVALG
jgi:hypothetical protein